MNNDLRTDITISIQEEDGSEEVITRLENVGPEEAAVELLIAAMTSALTGIPSIYTFSNPEVYALTVEAHKRNPSPLVVYRLAQ